MQEMEQRGLSQMGRAGTIPEKKPCPSSQARRKPCQVRGNDREVGMMPITWAPTERRVLL